MHTAIVILPSAFIVGVAIIIAIRPAINLAVVEIAAFGLLLGLIPRLGSYY
jgi:hypothetical protein